MRVVGGSLRRRALTAPEGLDVRPTSDRAREALFNILSHRDERPLVDARVLDVFAGSGALGIEALSRGAAHCTFLEALAPALAAIRLNLGKLGLSDRATVLTRDAVRPGRAITGPSLPASLVFLDPPYRSGLAAPALVALSAGGWIAAGALVSIEVGAKEDFAPPEGFTVLDERRYGAARLVLATAPGELSPSLP
ncbi:MAG: 16S rRNA (guanine(966)-N(2))-methyltransferase RsmD [Alphaproteobacteria bacterium]|nr:16S rRNA (guanine(966)-N(2))-methyltransferase RsmD [Alphaproteobacteria bacterium]